MSDRCPACGKAFEPGVNVTSDHAGQIVHFACGPDAPIKTFRIKTVERVDGEYTIMARNPDEAKATLNDGYYAKYVQNDVHIEEVVSVEEIKQD